MSVQLNVRKIKLNRRPGCRNDRFHKLRLHGAFWLRTREDGLRLGGQRALDSQSQTRCLAVITTPEARPLRLMDWIRIRPIRVAAVCYLF